MRRLRFNPSAGSGILQAPQFGYPDHLIGRVRQNPPSLLALLSAPCSRNLCAPAALRSAASKTSRLEQGTLTHSDRPMHLLATAPALVRHWAVDRHALHGSMMMEVQRRADQKSRITVFPLPLSTCRFLARQAMQSIISALLLVSC